MSRPDNTELRNRTQKVPLANTIVYSAIQTLTMNFYKHTPIN